MSSLGIIRHIHPEQYNGARMIKNAREAVFDQLDRFSGYLEPEELERISEEFSGTYGGIGITVVAHDKGLAIMSVREDGPAGRVGIRTGDIILQADSVRLEGISPYKATFLLRGKEGTTVEIKIARRSFTDTLEFSLQRERLKLIHIPYAGLTANNSLYIRIFDFESGLTQDLMHVIDSLCLKNDDTVKAVILDLRGNPGGLLNEAIASSDLFLDEGYLIVGIKGRSRWRIKEYHSSGRDIINGLPLAVLISRGSASASEILAGALKYAGRAVLIGDTTFGKGLVQEYHGLGDGSGIRLTTARYYFEGNVFLNDPDSPVVDSAKGIPPDFYFQSVGSEPFPVKLESSLLMREYAIDNRDEILAHPPAIEPSPKWLDNFIDYARQKEFSYKSELTRLTELVMNVTVSGTYSDRTREAVSKIYALAERDDSAQFEMYKDYVGRRLYQIAIEAEFGTERVYREAILPFRKDVTLAETILLSKGKE